MAPRVRLVRRLPLLGVRAALHRPQHLLHGRHVAGHPIHDLGDEDGVAGGERAHHAHARHAVGAGQRLEQARDAAERGHRQAGHLEQAGVDGARGGVGQRAGGERICQAASAVQRGSLGGGARGVGHRRQRQPPRAQAQLRLLGVLLGVRAVMRGPFGLGGLGLQRHVTRQQRQVLEAHLIVSLRPFGSHRGRARTQPAAQRAIELLDPGRLAQRRQHLQVVRGRTQLELIELQRIEDAVREKEGVVHQHRVHLGIAHLDLESLRFDGEHLAPHQLVEHVEACRLENLGGEPGAELGAQPLEIRISEPVVGQSRDGAAGDPGHQRRVGDRSGTGPGGRSRRRRCRGRLGAGRPHPAPGRSALGGSALPQRERRQARERAGDEQPREVEGDGRAPRPTMSHDRGIPGSWRDWILADGGPPAAARAALVVSPGASVPHPEARGCEPGDTRAI